MKKRESGFTLIELILTTGILVSLISFIGFNLVGTQRVTSENSTIDVLLSDMASQQTKAMQGIGLTSGTSYGIYFQTGKYTLFSGTSYSFGNSSNFDVSLDSGLTFTNITFPANTLVFSSRSGTVSGFLNGHNTVSVYDSQQKTTKTVTVNKYGAVTLVN
jgi:type II secretory pathway pseudopilin PulG